MSVNDSNVGGLQDLSDNQSINGPIVFGLTRGQDDFTFLRDPEWNVVEQRKGELLEIRADLEEIVPVI